MNRGKGGWREGVVVAVVPYGVQPWVWCRRHGFPGMFHRETMPLAREKYVVESGGLLFTPSRIEGVR